MSKRRATNASAPLSKKMKLGDYDHGVDDLFENENIHTLPSAHLSTKLKLSATKLNKNVKRILIQFTTRDGQKTGNPIDVSIGFDAQKLLLLINTLLKQSEDPLPYSFYYNHALSIQEKQKQNQKIVQKLKK
eukprot:768110_1